jgi:hypothetical protein
MIGKLLTASLLGLALSTAACIIVVDDTGMSAHAAWNDWESVNRPTLRGSGVSACDQREMAEFHSIEIRGPIDAKVRVGEERSVAVHADDNLLDHVVTRVEDGLLILEMERDHNYRFDSDLCVEVGAPALDGLQICGSGDAEIQGLREGALRVSVAGSGKVSGSGAVDALTVSIAGSGDVSLFDVKARTASVSIAGSGDVELDVGEILSVEVSGSGDVRYRGQPRVTQSIAGSGSVERD